MGIGVARLFLTLLLVGVPLAVFAGYKATVERPKPTALVVIEGVVVPGDTYRVEPLDEPIETWDGEGLSAEIRIVNKEGETAEVSSDERGRFRVGPIALSGHEGDVLTVTCPRSRALCLSALLPAEVYDSEPGQTVEVRWRISLPPKAREGSQDPA